MINYYKYLPVSKEDENWGLTVLNAGCTRIEASADYPLKSHPTHHNFNWNNWRLLHEYQIIYITNGSGVFESESVPQTLVTAGTIILLFPNERHRYKPDREHGWDEYWVGVKGNMMDNLLATGYIKPENACIYVGFNVSIVNIYNIIIEKTQQESAGYQQLVSGAVMHLTGTFYAAMKRIAAPNGDDELVINKARILFRANINNPYSPEQAAQDLQMGYSRFRKLFKSYTGLSPGQYYLQLKIDKAREMLSDGITPIKEISILLNFDSSYYFSRIFKEKTGLRPTDYRNRSNEAQL